MHGVTRGLLATLIIVLMTTQGVLAVSAVQLGGSFSLSDADLGLNGVAIDSDTDAALVYGNGGYVRVLDAVEPSNQVEMNWGGSEELFDADFHPGGQTALIVGERGVVLKIGRAHV